MMSMGRVDLINIAPVSPQTLDQALWERFGWWLLIFDGWPFIVWLTTLLGFWITVYLLLTRLPARRRHRRGP
jgi:hypothetical protein